MEVGMMLNSSLSSQTSLGDPVLSHGFSRDFIGTEKNGNGGNEPWIHNYDTQDESPSIKEEIVTLGNLQEKIDEDFDIVKPQLALLEDDKMENSSNGKVETNERENSVVEGSSARSQKAASRPTLISIKTEDDNFSLDLNHLSSTNVSPSVYQSQKAYLLRNVSLTEQELKEAQRLSDSNDAQLSPTQGSCSRGALLFHRRRQRLKAFEQRSLDRQARSPGTQQTPEVQNAQHGRQTIQTIRSESLPGSGRLRSVNNMDETSSDTGYEGESENKWEEFLPIDKRAPSPSASEEDQQVPLSAHLKETLMVSMSNGLVDQTKQEAKPTVESEQKVTQNGTQNKQYCEVHLTLSKPASVPNRTAKPFGAQPSAKKNLSSSSEMSPVIDLPPPPTYAETLSSPPPVTRIVSPPSYSALYPTDSQQFKPVIQVANHGDARLTPTPKTGILEEIGARRGTKKSMFTFIEKTKLTPNPDLLSMVQTSDERRKNKDQADVPTEEEHFALGAEASNFQNNRILRVEDDAGQNNKVPNWSSCLKSPGFKSKPPPAPIQTLAEAKGKGAELFAKRQSRMERFVVESPSPYDSVRSPSPAISLPPSWTFVSKAQSLPTQIGRQIKNNQMSPKPSSATTLTNTSSESIQSQKELLISKRQPYQLQSSLFILSPNRDPLSSLPKAAPPPKPMVMESQRFKRQSSCPTSPVMSPPTLYSPSYFNSMRSPSATMSPSPTSIGRQTPTSQLSPASPVPFSNTGVAPSRTKTIIQAPRPSFSARSAGLESQMSSNQRILQHRGSLDSWGSSAMSFKPVYEEGPGIQSPPPFRSMSPAWSDRSPSPFKVENDVKSGNQMKALLARNIINAAKRKSTSPWGLTSPLSPTPSGGIWSPTLRNGSPLPETPRGRRSPTFSEISVESEDAGTKSPGFRSYSFSPKGWYGSMRLKRDSLPANQAFTYTP